MIINSNLLETVQFDLLKNCKAGLIIVKIELFVKLIEICIKDMKRKISTK